MDSPEAGRGARPPLQSGRRRTPPGQLPAPKQRRMAFHAEKGRERNRTINPTAQVAHARPVGRVQPSALFHPAPPCPQGPPWGLPPVPAERDSSPGGCRPAESSIPPLSALGHSLDLLQDRRLPQSHPPQTSAKGQQKALLSPHPPHPRLSRRPWSRREAGDQGRRPDLPLLTGLPRVWGTVLSTLQPRPTPRSRSMAENGPPRARPPPTGQLGEASRAPAWPRACLALTLPDAGPLG